MSRSADTSLELTRRRPLVNAVALLSIAAAFGGCSLVMKDPGSVMMGRGAVSAAGTLSRALRRSKTPLSGCWKTSSRTRTGFARASS
jgi:hypothetical protein